MNHYNMDHIYNVVRISAAIASNNAVIIVTYFVKFSCLPFTGVS